VSRRLAAGLLTAAVTLAGCGGGAAGSADAAQRLAVNGLVLPVGERTVTPRLAGRTLTGDRLDVAGWRGHVVVVNFWGSWCAPCRKEQPQLERLARATAGRGVRFLGVDIRANRAAARAYAARFHVTYPSLVDGDGTLALAFGTLVPRAVPFTFVLDRAGRVAARYIGRTTFGPLHETVRRVVSMGA